MTNLYTYLCGEWTPVPGPRDAALLFTCGRPVALGDPSEE
jgi:hypothetical protein